MEHTVLLSVVTSAVCSVILARWWVQRMVVKAGQFILSDSKGRTRVTLRVHDDLPTVNVFDEQGKCRAGWVAQKDGSARVCFYDQNETATGMIRVGADGPTFAIEDADGRPRIELAVAPDGSLFISIGGRKTRGAVYRIEFPSSNPTPASDLWV